MGCALDYGMGLCCWFGPRCADCPTAEWAGPDESLEQGEGEDGPA